MTDAALDHSTLQPVPSIALPAAPKTPWRWVLIAVVLMLLLSALGLFVSMQAGQRIATLEHELVRRQQDSQAQAAEARIFAKQAQDGMNEAMAKIALLDARVAEVSSQRGQLEDIIQSLSRSRDENMIIELDAGIRVAAQQAAITGSVEPLVAALRQGSERLARQSAPRLESVRRAMARDLDRVRSVSVADVPALSVKLDEAIRLIDELPLIASIEQHRFESAAAVPSAAAGASAAASAGALGWAQSWRNGWNHAIDSVWSEVKSLVRVSKIDHPESVLLAAEQSFFVRENLKLRLLNARLALLSRQFDAAQSDLQTAQAVLDRYFDKSSRRHALASELIRQAGGQAKLVPIPRPDETLAALAALNITR